VIPILLALAAIQTDASAQAAADEARFRTCSELVRTSPERAVEAANAWRIEGGGFHARQCLGLAYVALDRWAQAAALYEEAARDADTAQDPRRADLWAQAGNAWLAAGEATRAVLALDAALATTNLTDELRGEVHLDRARAMVSLGDDGGARRDLDRALQLVSGDPFAWYLSAALARWENALPRAQTDIARALQLAPDDPEVVLLAGTIAGQAGNMAEAERLYRQVAEGAPDSEAGRQARASLETLREVEVDAPAAPAPAQTPPSAATESPH
jgi:tetratricopeptide (TPR) repeat protein